MSRASLRRLLPVLAVVPIPCVAAQQQGDDLAKLQGTWSLVSAERNGKKAPADEVRKLRLTIDGSKFTLRRDSVVVSEGKFTLHPDRNPKEIDETMTGGPNKGK